MHKALGAAGAEAALASLEAHLPLAYSVHEPAHAPHQNAANEDRAAPTPEAARTAPHGDDAANKGGGGAAGGRKGVTVVLLHGFLGCKEDWAEVVARLTVAGHRCVCVDLPGHGASRAGG